VITPAAIGPQYFREAAEVIKAATGGPPNREQMPLSRVPDYLE
jgi:hypothetical protein